MTKHGTRFLTFLLSIVISQLLVSRNTVSYNREDHITKCAVLTPIIFIILAVSSPEFSAVPRLAHCPWPVLSQPPSHVRRMFAHTIYSFIVDLLSLSSLGLIAVLCLALCSCPPLTPSPAGGHELL